MKSSGVYQDWKPLGILTGLLSKSGVYDIAAGIETIQGIFDQFNSTIRRKMASSCVDSNTGDYIIFNETVSNPAKAIISSASLPFLFPHQIWEDQNGEKVVCMDGGTVWNTNLVTAI
jgi:predicted acylesterase/phospholipase RssA